MTSCTERVEGVKAASPTTKWTAKRQRARPKRQGGWQRCRDARERLCGGASVEDGVLQRQATH
jgi:hypothetical protein